jgi:hypothetical protein
MKKKAAAPYLAFVNYVLKHPSPHYPTFLAINTQIKLGSQELVSVKVELLKENRLPERRLVPIYYWAGKLGGTTDSLAISDQRYVENEDYGEAELKLALSKNESFINALIPLVKLADKSSMFRFDFNNVDNIMRRGSTFVEVDPFAKRRGWR